MRPQSSSSRKSDTSKSLMLKDDHTSSMPNLKKGLRKSDSLSIPKTTQSTSFHNDYSKSKTPSAWALREYRKENKDANLDDSILDYKSNDNYFIDTMKNMFSSDNATLQQLQEDEKEQERKKRNARMKFLSTQIKHLGKDKDTFMTACKVQEEEEANEKDLEIIEQKLEDEERGMNEMLKDLEEAHSSLVDDELEELKKRIAATRKNLDMHISTVCGLRTNIMALDKNAKDFDNTYTGSEYAAIKSSRASTNQVAVPKRNETRLSNAGANIVRSTTVALSSIRDPATKKAYPPLVPKTSKPTGGNFLERVRPRIP